MHELDPSARDPFARLREDHARVLARLVAIEGAAPEGGALDEPALRALAEHLERQFATHMAAEDDVLFPAMRTAFPEARGTIDPLVDDHAELRQMRATLAALLDQPRDTDRDERIAVLVRDLSDLLRLHVRREESVVLDVAPRVLSRDEMAAMASRLEAWRDAHPEPAPPRGAERKNP